MPLYPFECDVETCGDRTEVLLLLRQYEAGEHPVCQTCGSTMHRIFIARGDRARHFDPVVYHESADGRLRFPGHVDATVPDGFVKKEIRTFREYEKFRGRVERIERSKVEQAVEAEEACIVANEQIHRGDLRLAMQRMSPAQRRFAELAIARNDARRPRAFDPNFSIEPFEMDQGNRDAWVDERTGWKARRA